MKEVPMNRKVPEFCLGAEYVVQQYQNLIQMRGMQFNDIEHILCIVNNYIIIVLH